MLPQTFEVIQRTFFYYVDCPGMPGPQGHRSRSDAPGIPGPGICPGTRQSADGGRWRPPAGCQCADANAATPRSRGPGSYRPAAERRPRACSSPVDPAHAVARSGPATRSSRTATRSAQETTPRYRRVPISSAGRGFRMIRVRGPDDSRSPVLRSAHLRSTRIGGGPEPIRFFPWRLVRIPVAGVMEQPVCVRIPSEASLSFRGLQFLDVSAAMAGERVVGAESRLVDAQRPLVQGGTTSGH
jgi:hypothetical protein